MAPAKDPKAKKLVSAVGDDATLVESIQHTPTASTAFAIHKDGTTTIATSWSRDGISYVPVSASHNLLKHRAIRLPGAPQDFGTSEELFDEIQAYASKYVSLSPTFLKVAAAYILLSWVYDVFNELPYLRFRGDYGSGKTRALTVFGSIAYKGFFASGASTVSPIFHTLDAFHGTLVFDEADFRFTDEKAELVKILNNGNVRGFPVLRTQVTAAKEFEPRAFNVFGPKMVAMRGAYDDRALESRFLTEEMSGRSLPQAVPISLPDDQEREAQALRCKLLLFRFRHRNEICVEPTLAIEGLEPRLNQILLPLLSVAPSKCALDAISSYAAGIQASILSDRASSAEGHLLTVLAHLLSEHTGTTIPLQDVVAAFSARFAAEYDRPITSRFLGGVLRYRLGLSLYKTNGIVALSLKDRSRLDALMVRYGMSDRGGHTAPSSH